MSASVVKCQICDLLSPNFRLHVSHLRLVHSKDCNFDVNCGIKGCTKRFLAFSAFNTHIYRHHRSEMGLDTSLESSVDVCTNLLHSVVKEPEESTDTCYENSIGCNAGLICHDDPQVFQQSLSYRFKETHELTAAKFLLNLREGHRVSQVALADVINGCQLLCSQAVSYLKEEVFQRLHANPPDMNDLEELFNDFPLLFESVQTQHRLNKFCVDHFNLVEPREVKYVNQSYWTERFSGTKREKVSRTDTFYYVPILETLKNLLQLEDFQSEILNPHNNCFDGKLYDFCDGTIFKSHPLFSVLSNALQIVAYYDELEVVNPIGSYVKKHKLGCMFFFLGNIRPQYRSTLKSIHLVSVGKHDDIAHYGIDSFLFPFVEDLKALYCDGIEVSISGNQVTLYGGLLAFLADNLAAHLVGGFKLNMSFALRVCRTCMVTPELLQSCFCEDECMIRTSSSHFEQCLLLSGPLGGHHSVSYGITRLSILEEVPGFSVIHGLPHDIMHDLFEGIVPLNMMLLIEYCVTKIFFTINELNDRINNFDFIENKPSLIDPNIFKKNRKIRQSASQMMALSKHFSILIGDKVPEDDQHWYCFQVMLKICSIALAPLATYDTIAYLGILIQEYLTLFQTLYPATTLKPKHHYMIHYPSQIRMFGPLIYSWTMRQESKLSFAKRVSYLSNYKNVSKTVANRHQYWLCHKIISDPSLLSPSFKISPVCETNPLSTEPNYVQAELTRLSPGLDLFSIVKHPKWVKMQSSSFKMGYYVLLKYDIYEPLFGKIIDLVICEGIFIICVEEYHSSFFYSHYNSFVIVSHGTFSALEVNNLYDHRPIHAKYSFVKTDKSIYISLPYLY